MREFFRSGRVKRLGAVKEAVSFEDQGGFELFSRRRGAGLADPAVAVAQQLGDQRDGAADVVVEVAQELFRVPVQALEHPLGGLPI